MTTRREEVANLGDLLAQSVARYGDRVALQVHRHGEWLRLTYRELLDLARAWSSTLDVAPGDRVLLVAESSPEWAIAYFAVMLRGGTVVPLDPQLSLADLGAIADRVGARLWLVSHTVAERLAGVPGLVEITDFAAVPIAPTQEARGPEASARADVASIPFTSGTTLAPKGVPLTHANFLANVRALVTVAEIDERDQFLCVLPLHHVLAFTASLIAPLSAGAAVTFVEKLTPRALLEAMQATHTTLVIAVPRLLALLVRGVRANVEAAPPLTRVLFRLFTLKARAWRGIGRAVPLLAPAFRALRALLFRGIHRRFGGHLRFFVSGGAALPPEYYDALDLYGFRVCEGYGLTETSPVLTLTPPGRPRRGTVGPAVPGVELRIAEPNEEGVGEVLARGPSVFGGYLEGEGADRFVEGWFRTGDLGRLDRAGYLRLAGRADDVIVTGGGKNVYPVEVEWLYRDLPHVKEFCVLGLPDPGSAGEAVQAVVVLEEAPDDASAQAWRSDVEAAITQRARQLPTHQRLRGVHFWEGELPRTPTLKIKRRQIRSTLLRK